MHVPAHSRKSNQRKGAARALVLLVGASVLALLVAWPAASAAAAKPKVTVVPSGSTNEVLGEIPLEDLGVSELAKLLGEEPALKELPRGDVEQALREALESLAEKGGTLGSIGEPGELLSSLEGLLKGRLSPSELLTLLKGQSLSQVLSKAIGEVEPNELLSKLLESSSQPEKLITEALDNLNPEKLESTVGGALAGEPFGKTTPGELAGSLGTSETELDEALDTNSEKLPESAMALTAPLSDNKTLAVLKEAGGLSLATLTHGEESAGSGGAGGKGGAGGSGGSGGSSGAGTGSSGSGTSGSSATSGGSGTPSMTIIIDDPQPSASAAAAHTAAGKVKLLSHRVHGDTVTVVVRVPGAGRLTVGGPGVKRVAEQTDAGEQVTIRTTLTKAAVASRRSHHNHLAVALEVAFTPPGGTTTVTRTSVRFV